ncbi:MAG: geranylgeranyl reductase family protein [Moorellales bacterium]
MVGAGPVGAFVAERLARRGNRVLIVEEHARVGHPVRCTGLIGEEAFARFDLPADPVQHLVFSISVFGPLETGLTLEAPRPLARVVDRARFDDALTRRALAAGAELLAGARVQDVRVENDGVAVVLPRRDGVIRCRSVVLACGGSSPLPVRLGFRRPRRYLFGAQVEVEMDGVRDVEVYVGRDIAPGSFGWVVPTAGNRARIGALVYDRPRECLQALLAHRRVKARLRGVPPRPAVAPIPLGTLPATVSDRVLVVGEAAGQVKATTGGGVYYGLLCAEIAAEVLAEALRKDRLSGQHLAAYETGWRQLLEGEIRSGVRLRHLARRLSDRAAAHYLKLVAHNGLREALQRLVSFDWHAATVAALLKEERRRLPLKAQ